MSLGTNLTAARPSITETAILWTPLTSLSADSIELTQEAHLISLIWNVTVLTATLSSSVDCNKGIFTSSIPLPSIISIELKQLNEMNELKNFRVLKIGFCRKLATEESRIRLRDCVRQLGLEWSWNMPAHYVFMV